MVPGFAGRKLLFDNAQQSLQAIQGLPSYQHMPLQPFSIEEVQQYMCVALDRHDITDQIAAAVHERTGGLPLYVEQVRTRPDLHLNSQLASKHQRQSWFLVSCSCHVAFSKSMR